MKLSLTSLPLLALLSASLVAANLTPQGSNNLLQARDICGSGYPGYTRRISSPCASSNGVHEFCSCDRTNIAKCSGGKWIDGQDCEADVQECSARDDGARAVCL